MNRAWIMYLCIIVSAACSSPKFEGETAAAVSEATSSEAQVRIAEGEDVSTTSECLLAVEGDAKSVVSMSHGNVDLSKIPEGSILLLKVQGQADINLSEKDISKLKGVCIFAAGQASIHLDFNAALVSIYYRSRGQAESYLDFGKSGTLKKIVADISGSSQLHLSGEKLACDDLQIPYKGSSSVTCQGKNL